jgi:uncharacterized protein
MVSAIAERQKQISALCARFGVSRLEVFGSAVSEDEFDARTSDIDFIVEFRPDQDLGPWLKHYFEFRDSLARLLGRSVDVVIASAMKNPFFIREANRTRTLVYAA